MQDRILLNVLVKRDGTSVTGAALYLGMAPSWGVKSLWAVLRRGRGGCGCDPVPEGRRASPGRHHDPPLLRRERCRLRPGTVLAEASKVQATALVRPMGWLPECRKNGAG